jgi:hypothetical protein
MRVKVMMTLLEITVDAIPLSWHRQQLLASVLLVVVVVVLEVELILE